MNLRIMASQKDCNPMTLAMKETRYASCYGYCSEVATKQTFDIIVKATEQILCSKLVSNIVIVTYLNSLAKLALSNQGENTVELRSVQFTYLASIIKVSIIMARDS